MAVVVVCVGLLALGVLLTIRWGRLAVRSPWADDELSNAVQPAGVVLRRYLWCLDVAVVSAIGTGVLVAGAGGRLVMRLLAVTADAAAQGRLTEAEEVVGRITVDGTIGFVVFSGLFAGLATAPLYLVVRRWLPDGRLGGVVYGLVLLVVAATRIEPLRADNPDFGLVGPGGVALAAFASLVLLHGMAMAAIAGRVSRAVPLLARDRRTWFSHVPLLVLLPAFPAAVFVALVGAATVGLSRLRPLVAWLRSPAATTVGRVALAAGAAVALPGFVSAVAEIAGRT